MATVPARRRRGFGSSGIAVVVVILAFAVLVAAVAFLRTRRQVFAYLIGDSITFDATDAFLRAMESKYVLAIDARPGYRAGELVDSVRGGTEAARPTAAVINLGTNDVNLGWPPDDTRRAFEQFAEIFAGMCVSVVTVNEFMPDPASRPRAAELNRWLGIWAKEHRFRVIDWSAMVQSRLTATAPEARVTTDGVHPTKLGADELAAAYLAALESC